MRLKSIAVIIHFRYVSSKEKIIQHTFPCYQVKKAVVLVGHNLWAVEKGQLHSTKVKVDFLGENAHKNESLY